MTITISKKGSDEKIGMHIDKEMGKEFFGIIKEQQFLQDVEVELKDDDNKTLEHAVVKQIL